MIAYAAAGDTAQVLVDKIVSYIVNPFIELLFGIAFIVFLWGVFQFIWGASDPKKREDGRKHMIWGIIGLFIMLTAYGILNFLVSVVKDIKSF